MLQLKHWKQGKHQSAQSLCPTERDSSEDKAVALPVQKPTADYLLNSDLYYYSHREIEVIPGLSHCAWDTHVQAA